MFCHAGPSSFSVFLQDVKVTDSDLQVQISKNKHTSLAENGENWISAEPPISAHLE